MLDWYITSHLTDSSSSWASLPTPKIILDPISWWSNLNNYPQLNRYDTVASVPPNPGSLFLGVQRDITDRDKSDWINNTPMVFMETKRGVYPDNRQRGTRQNSWEEWSHIPNTPSWIILGNGSRWNSIQLEPLNRLWSNYWDWMRTFFWWASWWSVPTFESEINFSWTNPGYIQIRKFNPYNFLQWLNNATLPIRYVDAAYDSRYFFYMHNKRLRGVAEPHTVVPLRVRFGMLDPADPRNVILSEPSDTFYLYLYSQELEKPNATDPWERYMTHFRLWFKTP